MTLGLIISLVRDASIVGALGWLLWLVHTDTRNADTVRELRAMQAQVAANAKVEADNAERHATAEAQRRVDMQTIAAAITSNQRPVFVRNAAGPCPVPSNPPSPAGSPPAGGGDHEGAGVDIRPKLNQVELDLEGFAATCRSVLASWPRGK